MLLTFKILKFSNKYSIIIPHYNCDSASFLARIPLNSVAKPWLLFRIYPVSYICYIFHFCLGFEHFTRPLKMKWHCQSAATDFQELSKMSDEIELIFFTFRRSNLKSSIVRNLISGDSFPHKLLNLILLINLEWLRFLEIA